MKTSTYAIGGFAIGLAHQVYKQAKEQAARQQAALVTPNELMPPMTRGSFYAFLAQHDEELFAQFSAEVEAELVVRLEQ